MFERYSLRLRQFRLRVWLVGLSVSLLSVGACDRSESTVAPTVTAPNRGAVSSGAERSRGLASVKEAISRGQLDVADQLLTQRLVTDPNDAEALELLGDLTLRQGDAIASPELFKSAIDQLGESVGRDLLDKWAKSLIRAGRPYDAIKALQELLQRYPTDAQARYDLAGLAAAFGVPEEALPSLRWLVQRGQSDPESLLVLANPARVEPDVESCQKVLAISGDDRRAEFGLAKFDALHHDWDAVAKRLQPIVAGYPDFVAAYALYGQALVESGDLSRMDDWLAAVPPTASESPLFWIVRGRIEQNRGRHEPAAKAFWQSLRHGGIIYPEVLSDLLVSLEQLQRPDDAEIVSDLIVKHTNLRDALKIHLERRDQSQAACLQVAQAMMDLGRVWEAEGWARMAVSLPGEKVPNLRERYMAIRERLNERSAWHLPGTSADSLLDLSDLADAAPLGPAANAQAPVRFEKSELRFDDQAERRHWNHVSIPPPQVGGHKIEQSVGGGVAVIDFDCDGWPDLGAATLDGTALKNDSTANRLSRNVDGSFVDVSAVAGYQDTGFGQGLTVADYNEDGFPDLFDANIGRNRLYRNNGDGTFTDVSDQVGLSGEFWTTSVAMVDLDGDRILDLFEVNYCAGRAPYERECRNKFGVGTCSPLLFDAEPDRVWRGGDDGRFTDMTDQWLNQISPGRGLGIVAGELDERPGIDVLVGNDMTVNHLWSSRQAATPSREEPFELMELGVVRGIGVSGKSHSQASMGIAAADSDGDGDLDLLMTHFSDDYNTYYEQIAPGFWTDRSYQAGLIEPSMKLLGFGTQWVDLDNRGLPELIVTNGHVDRVDRPDVSYRMPAQLFARNAQGRWGEWDRSVLGDYFTRDHLGRALVVLDVDRDGRCDVAISHLDDPASLLVNQTPDAGRAIGIELRATSSPRDAIGSRVEAKVDGRLVVSHLTAGDGYMASNERRIHLGCGDAETAGEVTVHWPSGRVEAFGPLDCGADYLLVEGSGESVLMREHES